MAWTKPAYTDLRIGFEVTMYFKPLISALADVQHNASVIRGVLFSALK